MLQGPFHGYEFLNAILTFQLLASRLAVIRAFPYSFIVVEIWASASVSAAPRKLRKRTDSHGDGPLSSDRRRQAESPACGSDANECRAGTAANPPFA